MRYIAFFFIVTALLVAFCVNFLFYFEEAKEQTLAKYLTQTKTTAIHIKEHLKKYLQDYNKEELEEIKSVFSSDFSSISIDNATFTITEKDLINLASNLDKKLAWEITNLTIDDNLGQIVISTQSDDLKKELLTINGSVPNELNKNLVPSSDIYTFIPSKNFRDISTLIIKFDATNQLDETKSSSVTINFDKSISSFKNNQNEYSAPQWFKNLIPISMEEETSKVNDSLQKDAVFYIYANIEKVYYEIYEKSSKKAFYDLLWFIFSICCVLFLWFLYKLLRKS